MNISTRWGIVWVILVSREKPIQVHRSWYRHFLLSVTLIFKGPFLLSQASVSVDETVLQTLGNNIQQILAEDNTPGGVIALIDREGPIWSTAIGVVDMEERLPVTTATPFRMGSISEMFVSLSVLKLVEEGRLLLDQPVTDLVPEIKFENPWEKTDPVLLVHLLEHTTGFDDNRFKGAAWKGLDPVGLREALDYNLASRISRWPPGRYFSHSESGPTIAAYIVEKVTGEGYETWLARSLLKQLEMQRATFDVSSGVATGHSNGVPVRHNNPLMRPSRAIIASVREMGHLVEMLLNRGHFRGRKILSEKSIQRMENSNPTTGAGSGIQIAPGLGNFSTSHRGLLWRGRSGVADGTQALIQYVPAIGKGFVVAINSDSMEVLSRVAELLEEHVLVGVSLPHPAPSQIPAWRISGLAGYYRPLTPRSNLDRALLDFFGLIYLQLEGNRLKVDGPNTGGFLIPVTDRRFRGPEDLIPTAKFQRDGGKIVLESFGRGLKGNYQAVVWWRVWLERLGAVVVLGLLLAVFIHGSIWGGWCFLKKKPLWNSIQAHSMTFSFIASKVLLVGLVLTYMGLQDPVHRLGLLTIYSGGLFLTSIAFTFLALLSIVQAFGSVAWLRISRGLKAYSLIASLAAMGVAVYLWDYGLIGLRTWAP